MISRLDRKLIYYGGDQFNVMISSLSVLISCGNELKPNRNVPLPDQSIEHDQVLLT